MSRGRDADLTIDELLGLDDPQPSREGLKNRVGGVQYIPTYGRRVQVAAMSACGYTLDQIASELDINVKTLNDRFPAELATAKEYATAAMGLNLYQKGMGDGPGAIQATIFWLRSRAGWRESPSSLELTGKDGGPVQSVTAAVSAPAASASDAIALYKRLIDGEQA